MYVQLLLILLLLLLLHFTIKWMDSLTKCILKGDLKM